MLVHLTWLKFLKCSNSASWASPESRKNPKKNPNAPRKRRWSTHIGTDRHSSTLICIFSQIPQHRRISFMSENQSARKTNKNSEKISKESTKSLGRNPKESGGHCNEFTIFRRLGANTADAALPNRSKRNSIQSKFQKILTDAPTIQNKTKINK